MSKKEIRTIKIESSFERCYDCPMHKSEQPNIETCYNERPYREILDSDTTPFPEWCKAEKVIK